MEKAAWGYAFRAMGYWLLTIVTLGALLPLTNFRLEKYMTDRSWFGDARFEQGGRWTGLYGAMKHLAIGLALLIGGFGAGAAGMALDKPALLAGYAAFAVGLVWFSIGLVSWRVQSFAWLARHRTLGGKVAFHAHPLTKMVILAWVVGSIVLALVLSVATGVIGGLVAAVLAGRMPKSPPTPMRWTCWPAQVCPRQPWARCSKPSARGLAKYPAPWHISCRTPSFPNGSPRHMPPPPAQTLAPR